MGEKDELTVTSRDAARLERCRSLSLYPSSKVDCLSRQIDHPSRGDTVFAAHVLVCRSSHIYQLLAVGKRAARQVLTEYGQRAR